MREIDGPIFQGEVIEGKPVDDVTGKQRIIDLTAAPKRRYGRFIVGGLVAGGIGVGWAVTGPLYRPLFPDGPPPGVAAPRNETPTPSSSETPSNDKIIIIEPSETTSTPSSIISPSPTMTPSELAPTTSTKPLPTVTPSPSESPSPSAEPAETTPSTPASTKPTPTTGSPAPTNSPETSPTARPDTEQGVATTVNQVWTNTPAVWKAGSPESAKWAAFHGPLSISVMPGVDQYGRKLDWQGWRGVANGAQDQWWRTFAQNANTLRAGKGTTYLSPTYAGRRAGGSNPHFPAAWQRLAGIVRQGMPSAKLVLPASCTAGEALPDPSTYDALGCTLPDNGVRRWGLDGQHTSAVERLEHARQQALAAGKPMVISIPHGDSKVATLQVQSWLREHAGTGAGQVITVG